MLGRVGLDIFFLYYIFPTSMTIIPTRKPKIPTKRTNIPTNHQIRAPKDCLDVTYAHFLNNSLRNSLKTA